MIVNLSVWGLLSLASTPTAIIVHYDMTNNYEAV
jgi:hypothetical protein